MSSHFYKVKTRYFKEVKSRKEQLLTCEHVTLAGDSYWRSGKNTMCKNCQRRTEVEQNRKRDDWWEGFWEYGNEHASDYVGRYGSNSDWEQTMMADFERQNPKPEAIFLRKKVIGN